LPWQAVGTMRHTRQAIMASVVTGITATRIWRESSRLTTDQNGAVWERLRHSYQRESTHKRDTRPEQSRKPDSRSFPIMAIVDLKSIHGALWLSVEVDSNRTCSGSSWDIGMNGTTLINSTSLLICCRVILKTSIRLLEDVLNCRRRKDCPQ
jgi:hypothetical protein